MAENGGKFAGDECVGQSGGLNHAETLDLDASGRILLPPSLRRRVQFDKEVTLVGRADRLELWNRERWEANMNAVLDMDPDELAEQLDKAGFRL